MTDQLTRADLDGMTPEQITDALDAGRLAVTLGQYAPDEAPSSTVPDTERSPAPTLQTWPDWADTT
ncbi:hypothetical protein GCM10025873_06470 [Demequina sediminis]|uniref:hypothetical protein n=1 Tax=Demequina sediminis TaxID=1930058 RepID=UPI0025731534|nr:hypothetical protein [Demequina sediminis]BDZ60856.1 hypothetical protein GCM10025873_06470 [Demequina sediminis]